MSENIIKTLTQLGFELTQFKENVYVFHYEGIKLVYEIYPDDANFFQLGIPLNNYNRSENELCKIANEINKMVKYVKACVYEENIWLIFEHELQPTDVLSELINNAVFVLVRSMHHYVDFMESRIHGSDVDN